MTRITLPPGARTPPRLERTRDSDCRPLSAALTSLATWEDCTSCCSVPASSRAEEGRVGLKGCELIALRLTAVAAVNVCWPCSRYAPASSSPSSVTRATTHQRRRSTTG